MNTKLSVNINKVALIRNSRGENRPDLLQVALNCESYGAQGITIHPRPDERHVKFSDIPILKKHIATELNIEGYPSERFINAVLEHKPAQVTLVPDPPGALTSSEGWDTINKQAFLKPIIEAFQKEGVRVSIFLNAVPELVRAAVDTGTDRIEFYTGPYAKEHKLNPENALRPYVLAGEVAERVQLGLNAGHDLDLTNLADFSINVPSLLEVSIGHALICDALEFGLKDTISRYLNELQG